MILLELGLSHFQLGLVKVRRDVSHLNVRYLGIQLAHVNRHRIHYHLDVLRAKLFAVQTQQTLRYLGQRCHFGFLVDVFLAVLLLKVRLQLCIMYYVKCDEFYYCTTRSFCLFLVYS